MKKIITYGTYDLLHHGHIRLLSRAKALGDYLIVGVTADAFDRSRGKINVQQSLMERIDAVRATGIADEVIVEEYEGQKIDDIKRYNIDTFAIGSDWLGKFDYLREYCEVVYLDRTEGVSSSDIRSEQGKLRVGMIGNAVLLQKFYKESTFVNGLTVTGVLDDASGQGEMNKAFPPEELCAPDFDTLLEGADAVYIASAPHRHYTQVKTALEKGLHVLCESPIATTRAECEELFALAKEKNLVLMEALKTAYATAYYRLLLLVKSGRIGDVVSVDATCTSLLPSGDAERMAQRGWNCFCYWGPTAMLPILQLLGTRYTDMQMVSHFRDKEKKYDSFTKVNFLYPHATASLKVANGAKSEGELIITGTNGYIYVPAPWWKTDYFEVRYEYPENNKRYFYQLEGEGIRDEISYFARSIKRRNASFYINQKTSEKIAEVIESFYSGHNLTEI